jgi:hypothetical protein
MTYQVQYSFMGQFLIWLLSSTLLYAMLSPWFGPLSGLVAFVLPLVVLAYRHEKKEKNPYKDW